MTFRRRIQHSVTENTPCLLPPMFRDIERKNEKKVEEMLMHGADASCLTVELV
jgi:hypothetical protein